LTIILLIYPYFVTVAVLHLILIQKLNVDLFFFTFFVY